MREDEPWTAEPFIARTYDDLRLSQGSRYMIIPLNAISARRPGESDHWAWSSTNQSTRTYPPMNTEAKGD